MRHASARGSPPSRPEPAGDLVAPLRAQDPYPLYARMLERGPYRCGDRWVLSRHPHVAALLKTRGPSKQSEGVPRAHSLRKHILFQDPPAHTRLRSVINDFFTPASLLGEEPMLRGIAAKLVNAVKDRRRMEFVAAFASRLPVAIMADQLGVPEAMHQPLFLLAQTYIFEFSRAPSKSDAAITSLRRYFDHHAETFIRDARPGQLIGRLGTGYEHGVISRHELIELCVILFAAGGETSSSLLGSAVLTLLRHPGQLDVIRNDRSLIPDAIEEILRYETPVPMTTLRVPGEPLVIDEIEIPAGQSVIGFLAAANRDPDKFIDPHVFDVRRKPQGHLAFGGGIHFCAGAALARLEATIMLQTLFDELPTLALDGRCDRAWRQPRAWIDAARGRPWTRGFRWREGTPTRSLRYLHLRW